jgi:hypothetical protein
LLPPSLPFFCSARDQIQGLTHASQELTTGHLNNQFSAWNDFFQLHPVNCFPCFLAGGHILRGTTLFKPDFVVPRISFVSLSPSHFTRI